MADIASTGPPSSDEELLVAARVDPEALGELFDRRYKDVVGYFYRRILCPHTAADLAAETFAHVWAARARFDPAEGTAMAWIMGVAGNLYRSWLRRGVVADKMRRRLGITTPALVDEDLEQIEALVDLGPVRLALGDALSYLSPKLRDAVILRVALDMPYEAVATTLDCSVGAARVRVSRGLERLTEILEAAP